MGADVTVYQSIDPAITTEFIGYDRLTAESEISVLTTEDEIVEALTDGQTGTIITKETPFYGTMGGQEGDFGQITAPDGSVFEVSSRFSLSTDMVTFSPTSNIPRSTEPWVVRRVTSVRLPLRTALCLK